MTPQETHEMLVRLAMEAVERGYEGRMCGAREEAETATIEAAMRERMAQAAQAITLDLDADADAHAAAGRLVAYMDAASAAENAASHYYPESPLLSNDERVAAERFRELATRLRARGRT